MTRAPCVSAGAMSPLTTWNTPPRTRMPRFRTTWSLVAVKTQPPRMTTGVCASAVVAREQHSRDDDRGG